MSTLKLTPQRATFEINGQKYVACDLIYKGLIHPKSETPKSYKEIGGFVCKEHSNYESGCVTIYKNRKGQTFASMYKDGCFNPYYAKCELIKS